MRLIPICGLVIWMLPAEVAAQISPGDLSQAHAHLEGIRNCTECHDIGNKVPDEKCLACHSEIQFLIDHDRGYHASEEVRTSDCIDCHSEHHGRTFDMMRFDQEQFDHSKAGYPLEGQHERIDCRDCHKPEFIDDPEIKGRKNTFLGLNQECLTCHVDFHQGTLSNDCKSCHDFQAFRPAPGFAHDETGFPLRGMHADVDCASCHETTTLNGRDFQEFSGVPHHDCVACHEDPHQGRLDAQCKQCHTEEGFERFVGHQFFNHEITGFRLKGQHRSIDCFQCHQRSVSVTSLFQDHKGVRENQCIACHEDVHEDRFGNDCAQCHNENSFLDLNSMEFFDHSHTDYPLEGKHVQVDCKACHTGRYTEPIDFSACRNCHEDYHNGVFADPPPGPDCADCHTVRGFEYTTYGLDEHQESDFPLEGAHIATPCIACHLEDEEWRFADLGRKCVDCHDDIHRDLIPTKYYPEQQCDQCHVPDRWSAVSFDHDRTDWSLKGQHAVIDCRDCHFSVTDEGDINQVFSGLETQCTNCHESVHGGQFEIEGTTDCTRCHTSEHWFPDLFDHDQTAFPLDGRHAEIECKACHKPIILNGEEVIEYKMDRYECIDCHS